jgi:septation ring formation regulator EzrA
MEQGEEVKKARGGARANAGRKTVASEQRVNDIFLSALKSLKSVETDDEAKIEFAKDLYSSQRGQIFIAEHLFGKPKETVETTHNINNFDIKELFTIDKDTPKI